MRAACSRAFWVMTWSCMFQWKTPRTGSKPIPVKWNTLFNLAANARDAMPSGGMFSIKTGLVSIDSSDVDCESRPLGPQYQVLEVADTGKGIPSEEIAKIFLPFYSTKGE